MSQTWNDEDYDQQQEYDDQYYEQDYEQEQPAREEGRRSSGLLTTLLILGVVACSCLSCLIGAGLGVVAWDELNYKPASEASKAPEESERVAPTRAQANASWQSGDVVEAFLAAGLECESPKALTVDDGKAPFVAVEATRFMMPSVCKSCSGRIYSFDDDAELDKAKQYYVDIGDQDPQKFSWVYSKDNILLQLNGSLAEEQAVAYEQVLMDLQ